MGDRTCVTIYVREADFDRMRKEFGGDEEKMAGELGINEFSAGRGLVAMLGFEVNYADWIELQVFLQDHFIEYDKQWDQGGGYSAGESFVRKIGDKMQEVEIEAKESGLVEFLEEVKDLPAEKIREEVQKRFNALCPFEFKPLVKATTGETTHGK